MIIYTNKALWRPGPATGHWGDDGLFLYGENITSLNGGGGGGGGRGAGKREGARRGGGSSHGGNRAQTTTHCSRHPCNLARLSGAKAAPLAPQSLTRDSSTILDERQLYNQGDSSTILDGRETALQSLTGDSSTIRQGDSSTILGGRQFYNQGDSSTIRQGDSSTILDGRQLYNQGDSSTIIDWRQLYNH